MLVALLGCGVLTAPSLAVEPLPVTSVSPADGATIPVPSGPVPFELVSSTPGLWNVSVEVATQNIPGQDGSLANDFQVDFFSLFRSDAFPTVYRGQSGYVAGGYWWNSAPGTYYWQIHATTTSPYAEYLSPVFTLTIATPFLSLSEASFVVKTFILEQTRHRAHHLLDKCQRTSQANVTCKASWMSAAHVSSSTLVYAGYFAIEARADNNYVRFLGLRERYGCASHHGSKRCATKVHWP